MAKFASVDDYLASLPGEQRAVLEEIERLVLAVVPGAERVIRYDMPTWQVDGLPSSMQRRGSSMSRCIGFHPRVTSR